MACPYMNDTSNKGDVNESDNDKINGEINHDNDNENWDYGGYLKLRELLSCTETKSEVHDEHLFIIVHQVYELWFKQIIYELDSVRQVFSQPPVDERIMLKMNTRLERIVKILDILVEQIKIVETITPLDFAEFRGALGSASGFQSWQFRLLENKLGVKHTRRIRYNDNKYTDNLQTEFRDIVEKSENELSLFDLINSWLERTPGLKTQNFDFWEEFTKACQQWFSDELETAQNEKDTSKKEALMEAYKKTEKTFNEICTKEDYDVLVAKGDRSLSWAAFKGALMIYYNRNEVHFHIPFQMLSLLMDIDSMVSKWRSAHVLLVQRQIGSKLGTGGSSGYYYLRSTVSDRYRPFLDLFQLSNYLIPYQYIKGMKVKETKHVL